MNYITSRETVALGSNRYNLWRIRLYPFNELSRGDVVFWYETKSESIVWAAIVTDVKTFEFENRAEVERELAKMFHTVKQEEYLDKYFERGKARGYCLAFKVKGLATMNWAKPDHLKFPQNGWMRASSKEAMEWLGNEPSET
jgi:hypothetical protein